MTDTIAAVVAALLADPAVDAAVDSRVFGGEIPRSEVTSMPRAAVVVTDGGAGLLGGGYQQYSNPRVNVACYADTPHGARTLYGLVHDALKQLRRGVWADTLVHSADESSAGVTGRDPDTDWSVTYSSWLVLASEVAAA